MGAQPMEALYPESSLEAEALNSHVALAAALTAGKNLPEHQSPSAGVRREKWTLVVWRSKLGHGFVRGLRGPCLF